MSGSAAPLAPMSAGELLAEARAVTSLHGELGPTAVRSAALLGRTALEESIWSLFPQLKDVSGRMMLIAFRGVLRNDTARQASLAWGRLSAASHHHAYEMPPSTHEINALLNTVEDVLAAVDDRLAAAVAKATNA